jgi:uncharacterized membrane protein YozB (DUF420 family)
VIVIVWVLLGLVYYALIAGWFLVVHAKVKRHRRRVFAASILAVILITAVSRHTPILDIVVYRPMVYLPCQVFAELFDARR